MKTQSKILTGLLSVMAVGLSSATLSAAPLEGERLTPDLTACASKLERRSQGSFECRVDYPFSAKGQLVDREKARFQTWDCDLKLVPDSSSYQLVISKSGMQKRPFLHRNDAEKCLRELSREWSARPYSMLLVFGR